MVWWIVVASHESHLIDIQGNSTWHFSLTCFSPCPGCWRDVCKMLETWWSCWATGACMLTASLPSPSWQRGCCMAPCVPWCPCQHSSTSWPHASLTLQILTEKHVKQNHLLTYSQKSVWSLWSAWFEKDLKSQWLCLLLQCLESHHLDYSCTPDFEQCSTDTTNISCLPFSRPCHSLPNQPGGWGHQWIGQRLLFVA